MASCTFVADDKGHAKNSIKKSDSVLKSKEYSSAFICPMHCKGSGSDSAGTCPVCNMNYVKNSTNPKKDN